MYGECIHISGAYVEGCCICTMRVLLVYEGCCICMRVLHMYEGCICMMGVCV